MNYFSHLEYELSNEKERAIISSSSASKNLISLATMTSTDLINANKKEINTSDQYYYSCVVDRNGQMKLNTNQVIAATHCQVQPLAITPDIMTNSNVFYEIIQSMPELSKLQIR